MNARRKGFTLVELLVVIAILGLLAMLVVPAVNYAMFLANKGLCATHLANFNKANQLLSSVPGGPIGNTWIEGLAWNVADEKFKDPPVDAIEKSRLALWRLVADPEISKLGISPGGPSNYHCPGATKGEKTLPDVGTQESPKADFAEPYDELYYSFFLQTSDNIPTYGTHPNFIVAGDRSLGGGDGTLTAGGDSTVNNSANHAWGNERTGQNILFSGGSVTWKEEATCGINDDDIYLAAGAVPTGASTPTDKNDTCLMPVK